MERERRDRGILGGNIRVGKSGEVGMGILCVCVCVVVRGVLGGFGEC